MAQHKIYMGGDLYIGGGGTAVQISKEEGNVLENKTDGLYVPAGAVEISKEENNIIKLKSDGIYAALDENDIHTVKTIEKIVANDIETEDIDFSNFFN